MIEVMQSFREPAMTFKTNVIGMGNLFNAFGRTGRERKKKFIFASSGGALYGAPKKIPAAEGARSSAAFTVRTFEIARRGDGGIYARHFGFDFTVLRYANVSARGRMPAARPASSPSSDG